jgi:hypothetical protein
VKRILFLTIIVSLFSMNPAFARCYTDQCAEERISAFFTFLPLIIWGFFVWAAFAKDMQVKEKKKNTQMKVIVCFAFIPVWWLTTLLLG